MTDMINPKKDLVISSLKSLHRERIKILFKLNSLKQEKNRLNKEELNILKNLSSLEQKMLWEFNTNGKILND